MSWIDVSVFGGNWPFRAHEDRTPRELEAYLAAKGVTQAWITSASAILYPDPMQGNERLFAALQGAAFFVPVAVIDPTLATWRRDLIRCVERWGARAVRLFPNYHQYGLEQPVAVELTRLCAELGLPVLIQARMMDERVHHPLMRVPPVPPEQVAELARAVPRVRILACGVYHRELERLRGLENVWVETSLLESGHTLVNALAVIGPERLVFGSMTPLLSFAAGAAKLDPPEGIIERAIVEQIHSHNARALLSRR